MKRYFSPLLSVIFMVLASAFFTTFLTLLLYKRGYSKEQIGFLQSAFFSGMFVGAFKMEDVIRRIGHIQALACFGSLGTCALLLQAIYPNFWVWMLLRFLFGLSLAALYIVIESWLLHFSTKKTRGTIMALYIISITLSQTLAQQLLDWVDLETFTPFMIAALFTSLSVIPVSLSTTKIPIHHNPEFLKFSAVFKISPFGVILCFASGILLSSIQTFFPLLAIQREISPENFMTATLAGGVFFQWPIGKFSDHFERRKSILLMIALTLFVTVNTYIYRDFSPATLLFLTFCLGGLISTLYPLSISLVCDHFPENQITTAISLLLIAYGLGSVLGPLISSTTVGTFGIYSLYPFFAIILLLSGSVGVYTALKRPVIPEEEKTEFVPLTNTTPVVLEIDPRSPPDTP